MTGSGASSKEQHAPLSPSGAERWLQCPASVRMSMEVPPAPESSYAEEGTCFHALCEIEVRRALTLLRDSDNELVRRRHIKDRNAWRKKWMHVLAEGIEEEMEEYAAAYVDLILVKASEHPDTQVLLEQRLSTGIPSCWGTGDAVLVSPTHVEVIDAKYGSGVFVEVEGNPQLRLYGVGALEGFGDLLGDTESVTTTVFQPRMNNVASETMTPDDLREWRDSIVPTAEIALGENAPFGPSEEACRWCPASGQCRAQLEWATALDFGTDPDVLSPEDIAEAYERIPSMLAWADAVKAIALDKAYSKGETIPGYKVVLSNGRRYFSDEAGAIEALMGEGHDLDEVSKRTIRGIGELERLVGKKEFATLLDDFIAVRPGSPSLVKDTDKRPSIDPNSEAAKEFEE